MSLLALRGVSAAYGPAEALHDVSLEVGEGRATALLGRNGMGKTTTVKAIFGMLPARGRIAFAGRDVTGWPSHRIARLGIGLVPEGRRPFAPLSVAENLAAAARPGEWDAQRVSALFPRLGERMGQRAGTLSGGEQQMLAIGRALMTNPRLLILDEATEGLAPLVRRQIWDALAELKRATALSFLVIDKSLADLSRVADSAVILTRGRSVWSGPFAALPNEIRERHLGV